MAKTVGLLVGASWLPMAIWQSASNRSVSTWWARSTALRKQQTTLSNLRRLVFALETRSMKTKMDLSTEEPMFAMVKIICQLHLIFNFRGLRSTSHLCRWRKSNFCRSCDGRFLRAERLPGNLHECAFCSRMDRRHGFFLIIWFFWQIWMII